MFTKTILTNILSTLNITYLKKQRIIFQDYINFSLLHLTYENDLNPHQTT